MRIHVNSWIVYVSVCEKLWLMYANILIVHINMLYFKVCPFPKWPCWFREQMRNCIYVYVYYMSE